MNQDSPVPDSMPKCGCGRSLHMPYCDGSHGRSEKQYAEWKLQTELEQQAAKAK
jgi:CDGSH-type Zn-finger protein